VWDASPPSFPFLSLPPFPLPIPSFLFPLTHTALFHQIGSQTQKTQKTNKHPPYLFLSLPLPIPNPPLSLHSPYPSSFLFAFAFAFPFLPFPPLSDSPYVLRLGVGIARVGTALVGITLVGIERVGIKRAPRLVALLNVIARL